MKNLDGSNTGAFVAKDWALLVTTAIIWGSSFLWVSIALESLEPQSIALLRLILGSAAIWMLPAARVRVDRAAWRGIVVVAVIGNAIPLVLLPFAQQRIESSLAGMLMATTPLATLAVTMTLLRRSPGRRQILGLLIGFAGVAIMAVPNMSGVEAQPFGILLIIIGVFGFGVSNNALVPLQQKYGSAPIISRALSVSVLVMLPFGASSLVSAEPTRASLGAVLVLGLVSTGLARTLNSTVLGRAGATRGAIVGYLIPIVAIILGVLFRDESIGLLELVGTAIVLVGAYLVSRGNNLGAATPN